MISNLIELLFMKFYFAFSDNIDYVFLLQVGACYGMQKGQHITNILPKKSFSLLFVPYFYFCWSKKNPFALLINMMNKKHQ